MGCLRGMLGSCVAALLMLALPAPGAVAARAPQRLLKCVDTFAACPGWVGQCAVPGVATYCPCMCGGTPPPPTRCTSQPTAPSNANPFSCANVPANPGATCSTTCVSAFTGSPTATCGSNGVWTVSGSCTGSTGTGGSGGSGGTGPGCTDTYAACPGWVGQCAVPGVATYCPCMCGRTGTGPVQCTSQPTAPANANPFNCGTVNSGATCTTQCASGFTGSVSATCGSTGSWTVTGSCTSTSGGSGGSGGSGNTDSAAGMTKDLFTKVFAGDVDKCGSGCPGYSSNPNTQGVIDKHWGFFKSAAAARSFSLQNLDEASIFFGTIRHEYGGNLDNMREFCGRQGQTCPGGYGNYFGRGPLQLTWDYNYRYVAGVVARDLIGNPDQVADNTQDLAWQAAMIFWVDSNLNCGGKWGDLANLPTCQVAARAGNLAGVTRRVNPIECSGGSGAGSQPARIQQVQTVRALWGLPALTQTSC